MTDDAAPPPDLPPEPEVQRRNRLRLSMVWLVPLVAVLVGLVLVVRNVLQAGPEIVIEFATAEGVEAGKTQVRYKEVPVGRVSAVRLSADRQRVLVNVELDKEAANMAVADSRFWVVRPRIGTAGVSGLGTLLSGAYIGVDAGISHEARRRFVGLEAPPFVLRNEPGRSFVLNAGDLGSLDIGSPVYYRRTRVGRVVGFQLDPAPDQLKVQIFVEAPNERLVTTQSRFWNASGIDLSLNANGLQLNTQSMASVIAGGVAFANTPSAAPAPQAAEGTQFTLFADQKRALAPADGPPLTLRMVFAQSARGLADDAPIEVLGVEIGRLRAVRLVPHPNENRFAIEATADVYPLRLGLHRQDGMPADERGLMKMLVEQGMRAQMRTGNLLTGQKYVAFDFLSRPVKPATLDVDAAVPTMPTEASRFGSLEPQLLELVRKLSAVPFDDIGRDLRTVLRQADATIRQLTPEARRALADVQRTLQQADRALQAGERAMAAGERSLTQVERNITAEDAPLQQNAQQTLGELQRAAQALRTLADYLQRHPESLLRGKPADPAPAALPR